MFELYTEPTRKAVVVSQRVARAMGHGAAWPAHLLLALSLEPGNVSRSLEDAGISVEDLQHKVSALSFPSPRRLLHLAKPSELSCKLAVTEAAMRRAPFVRSGHLLLVLLRRREIGALLASVHLACGSVRERVCAKLSHPELLWLGEESYTWV